MNLLGRGNNPKFWSEEVRFDERYAFMRENLLNKWNKYKNEPIEELKYTDFIMFGTTGNRVIFEAPYFRRRDRLMDAAILCLIYPEEQEYLDYLHNLIFAICNEFTWTLPAHQPDILTNTDNTFIDLFDCETGGELSEIYALLEDRLDPLVKNRIKLEVKNRVVDPYLKAVATNPRFPWWRGGYTGNWVAVCTANIATSIFHLYPECYTEAVAQDFERILGNFLSGFSDNGFCDEGPGYWGYGFGFFVVFADLYRKFTEGKINYFDDPKVKKIATYLQKMYLTENCVVSFSDAGKSCNYDLGLLHFLKATYPDDVKVYSPKYGNMGGKIFAFRTFIWFDKDLYDNPDSDKEPYELYDEGYQWLIKKGENYSFAAKAGHNAEHHNHNDVGTFIFAKCGKQLISDLGSGVYTKEYGSPVNKYANNECSSSRHNLPIFDEFFQRDGAAFKSTDVSYEPGKFSMDIAGAYGLENLKCAKRVFTFDDEKVKVSDSFCYDGSITERLIIMSKPVVEGCGKITAEKLELTYDGTKCKVEITENKTSRNETYYATDFILNDGVREFEISIK